MKCNCPAGFPREREVDLDTSTVRFWKRGLHRLLYRYRCHTGDCPLMDELLDARLVQEPA